MNLVNTTISFHHLLTTSFGERRQTSKRKEPRNFLNLTGLAPNFLTMNHLGSFLGNRQERVCS